MTDMFSSRIRSPHATISYIEHTLPFRSIGVPARRLLIVGYPAYAASRIGHTVSCLQGSMEPSICGLLHVNLTQCSLLRPEHLELFISSEFHA